MVQRNDRGNLDLDEDHENGEPVKNREENYYETNAEESMGSTILRL